MIYILRYEFINYQFTQYVFKKEKNTFTYFIVFINNYIAFHILNRFEMLVEKYTSIIPH